MEKRDVTSKPLVSVITPTYNHEKYIGHCIQSVINQTYTNWEMWILDDGSPDNTASIAESYSVCDSRVHLIRQENKGIFCLAENYNRLLSECRGEWIAILEGDDYWEPEKLQVQIEAVANFPEAVMCWAKAASRVGAGDAVYQIHPVNSPKNREYYDNMPPGNIFNVIFDDFLPPLTYLIRKSSLEMMGGFIQVQPFPAVDLSTVLQLSLIGRFVFVDQVLGTWRIFPDQTTKTKTLEILEGSQAIITSHFDKIKETHQELLKYDLSLIRKNYRKRKMITLTRSGRFKLIRKDFKGARRDYIQALKIPVWSELLWIIRALTGLIFSFLNMDVEKLAQWFGKGSLKSMLFML